MNYIVFELVLIDVDKYKSDENGYRAEQSDTIYLAVIPEQFNFSLVARDAIVKTDNRVFLQKFSFMPERVRISGTFGDKPRLVAGTYMDGWTRLRQFRETIVEKSKTVEQSGKYIYALNYYDFIWQKFGSIDIRDFQITGNARANTNLPNYSCDFIMIGDLIKVNGTDAVLIMLNKLIGENGFIQAGVDFINAGFDFIQPAVEGIGGATELLATTNDLVQSAFGFIQSSGGLGETIWQDAGNLF